MERERRRWAPLLISTFDLSPFLLLFPDSVCEASGVFVSRIRFCRFLALFPSTPIVWNVILLATTILAWYLDLQSFGPR